MYPDTVLLELPEATPTARTASGPLPAELHTDSATEKFVAFRIAERLFAVKATSVSEVILPQPITAIPHIPDFILGIIELSGNLYPVIDLPEFIFGEGCGASSSTKMIVLCPESDAASIVFPVEKIAEIMWFDAVSNSQNRETSPLAPQLAEYNGEAVHILDSAGLTAEISARLSD